MNDERESYCEYSHGAKRECAINIALAEEQIELIAHQAERVCAASRNKSAPQIGVLF